MEDVEVTFEVRQLLARLSHATAEAQDWALYGDAERALTSVPTITAILKRIAALRTI